MCACGKILSQPKCLWLRDIKAVLVVPIPKYKLGWLHHILCISKCARGKITFYLVLSVCHQKTCAWSTCVHKDSELCGILSSIVFCFIPHLKERKSLKTSWREPVVFFILTWHLALFSRALNKHIRTLVQAGNRLTGMFLKYVQVHTNCKKKSYLIIWLWVLSGSSICCSWQ